MADADPIDPPAGVPVERVDELYGLALDEFTPRRDALAAELRQAGRQEPAAWVKGLRKPTVAAWAVNQLARTQSRATMDLIEAGEQLRAAQREILAGRARAVDLRGPAAQHEKAIRALLARAPGLLDREGRSPTPATLEKVEQTLHAVALDADTGARFAAGRLARERRAAGFGPLAGGIPRAEATDETGAEVGTSSAERRARAREALKAAKAEQRERRREVGGAEREVAKARRELERAQSRLEAAARELERARAAETEADADAADAERELGDDS